MAIAGLILGFFLVFIIDLRGLLRTNRRKAAFLLYSLLLSIGFIISLLQIIGKQPPSPAVYIEKIVSVLLSGVKQ